MSIIMDIIILWGRGKDLMFIAISLRNWIGFVNSRLVYGYKGQNNGMITRVTTSRTTFNSQPTRVKSAKR